MRDSNIGHELKDMAQEFVRFGERCVQAGRDWLNERRDEMNHRNDEGRRDYQSGREYGQEASNTRGSSRQGQGRQYGQGEQSERGRQQQFSQGNRSRGEYYGGGQFDERIQSAGWDEDRGNWDYEGGPERYGTSGYGEHEYGQGGLSRQYGSQQQYGSQHGSPYGSPYSGQREYGSQSTGGDYYRGRQSYGAQGSFGSDYNTYGRNQGFGEGSGYARPLPSRSQSSQFRGTQGYGSASRYGGESAGLGGRGALYGNQNYLDEGEMSGYGGRELSSQQYGSSSSGRYGTAPGQYGYGGYGGSTYRGVGPKNYRRSDERLTEDINERLTDDDDLDASNLTVRVTDGKVTLEGTVDQRWMKHRAEDIADACIGVKEVDNRINVSPSSSTLGQGIEVRGSSTRTSQSSSSTTTTQPGSSSGTISH